MSDAYIKADPAAAYKTTVMMPCFLKEVRSPSHDSPDSPFYLGCPKCKKSIDATGECPEHGHVTAIEVTGAIVVLQDATATFEAALWKEPLEALLQEFDLGDAPRDEQLTRLQIKLLSFNWLRA